MERAGDRDPGAGVTRAVPHVGLFVCASLLLHVALVVTWLPGGAGAARGGSRALHTLHATLAMGSRDAPATTLPRSAPPPHATLPGTARAAALDPRPGAPAPGRTGAADSAGVPMALPVPTVARAISPDLAAWLAQQRAARGAAAQAGLEAALQDLPAGEAGEIRCTLSPASGSQCQGLATPGLPEPVARILVAAGTARREGLLPSPAILMAHGTTVRVTWTAD